MRIADPKDRAQAVIAAAGVALHALISSGRDELAGSTGVKLAFNIAELFIAEAEARGLDLDA